MNDQPTEPRQDAGNEGDTPPVPSGPRLRTKDEMLDVLRTVIDPELHMNIVDLGLVYGVSQEERTVKVDMTLTTPGCPYGPYLLHMVRESLMAMEGVEEAEVNVVWEPAWSPEKMSEEARLEFGFEV
jgi:metal-sulfur cluster biosynthetic enzyme